MTGGRFHVGYYKRCLSAPPFLTAVPRDAAELFKKYNVVIYVSESGWWNEELVSFMPAPWFLSQACQPHQYKQVKSHFTIALSH